MSIKTELDISKLDMEKRWLWCLENWKGIL